MPATPVQTSDFTFGIEIECYLKNNDDGTPALQVGGYHNGRQIEGLPVGWNAQHDGSLGYKEGHTSVEIVSPKLTANEDAVSQIKTVCEYIKSKNGKVSVKCGFHVHIGLGRHLNPQNINKLVILTQYWQPALYAITGTTRRENSTYCKPRTESFAKQIIQRENIPSKVSLATDRYTILNLQPLGRGPGKQTVEYRVFSGTVSYQKIMAYVQIALGIAEAACGNISMTSLKWNATGRVASEMAQGRYCSIVRELIRYLWRIPVRPGNSRPRGVISPSGIMECKDELNRLAKQYTRAKQRASEEASF